MPKSTVKVNPRLDDQINRILWDIEKETNERIGQLAEEVAETARASSAFEDYKYTPREPKSAKAKRKGRPKNLRKTIKAWWNEKERCWVVSASAPHAHLIEFGHVQVTPKGKVIGSVAPRPFLRPAVDEVIMRAKEILGA